MTSDSDRTATGGDDGSRTASDERYDELIHRIDERSSGPDRVTVFPADATDAVTMSTWMTVNAGCVKALDRQR